MPQITTLPWPTFAACKYRSYYGSIWWCIIIITSSHAPWQRPGPGMNFIFISNSVWCAKIWSWLNANKYTYHYIRGVIRYAKIGFTVYTYGILFDRYILVRRTVKIPSDTDLSIPLLHLSTWDVAVAIRDVEQKLVVGESSTTTTMSHSADRKITYVVIPPVVQY